MALNSPRGTADLVGEEIKYRNFIIDTARRLFKVFNYSEIITPVFEYTELFDRSIGEGTDIVRKEMYTFKDKKGRSLTLRPEGTAPVVRAIIEQKMFSGPLPLKLFYIENMFRYERPQKGRMREFWQLGVEAAGTDDPFIDAEVIWLLACIFEQLGFNNLKLLINSVGCDKCRKEYTGLLKKYLEPEIESLCIDCKTRYEKNPLRVFDCKVEDCAVIIGRSPKIYDYLCDKCRQNFTEVTGYLKALNIDYIIKPELVRGFDYYTGTIFEIVSEALKNVQNALGGGGRYDRLVKQFGGPDMPATGFAVGIDRTVVLMKQLGISYKKTEDEIAVSIILMKKEFQTYGLRVMDFLRKTGLRTELSYGEKSVGSHIKWAEKNGFSHVIIIGEEEAGTDNITIKDLKSFNQYSVNWIEDKQKITALLCNEDQNYD